MRADEPVLRFRREVRRLAAGFLAGRIDRAAYLRSVRAAAVEAGLLDDRRPRRADRVLDALAWGSGAVAPGELPARLEPAFQRHLHGRIERDELRRIVAELLGRASQWPEG
jgi:hypothetical protein